MIFPSLVAPIFVLSVEAEVGPVPSKTSLRLITSFDRAARLLRQDGRQRLQVGRDLGAESAADLGGMTRTMSSGTPQMAAVELRMANDPCVQVQTVSLPSPLQVAVEA